MQALTESKSNSQALITMSAVLAVFLVTAAVRLATGVTLPFVGETLAAIVGCQGIVTARNAYVDAPLRRATMTATYGPPPTPPPLITPAS